MNLLLCIRFGCFAYDLHGCAGVYHATEQLADDLSATEHLADDLSRHDGRRVFITVEGLTPVMQWRVQAGLKTAGGAALPVEYYGTIHRLRPLR